MATHTVTNTQDTDAQLNSPPADAPGSLRAAWDAAVAAGGGSIVVTPPANTSVVALLSPLATPATATGALAFDFTGAPGLTLSSAPGSTARPYNAFYVTGPTTVTGALAGDINSGVLFSLAPTGSLTLNAGAALLGGTTYSFSPTILDNGAMLTLQANTQVTATSANAIVVTHQNGAVANQAVTIANGASVSASSPGFSTIYADARAQGATVTNSGTISSTGSNAYYAPSSAALVNAVALVNTSTGSITSSASTQ